MRKLNGIHIKHFKNTENCKFETMSIPQKVRIPMSMHMGVPCEPIVKVNDIVAVGQKIGDSDAPFSVPVHSSVSGKVTAIGTLTLANGAVCKTVEIESDGKQNVFTELRPQAVNDRKSLVKAVRESGVSGMGGAGFPTHIKLNPKTPIDTIVINAAECEPYITSDYRTMIETPENVISGIKMIMRALDIPKTIIAIENNKPQAISVLKEKCSNDDSIDILTLPSQYPQGAEKVIIYSATGRIVEEGKLPSDYGVIVLNVSTVASIYKYCMTGMPFVKRRLTVDGDIVDKKCNVEVAVGTSVSEILDYVGVDKKKIFKLISGGPMMGSCLPSADYPITKTMNSLLIIGEQYEPEKTACIRCAKCVNACPFNLMPTEIERAYKAKNIELLKKLKVTLCMNCGCCSYICPANRNPAEINQLAKALIPRK